MQASWIHVLLPIPSYSRFGKRFVNFYNLNSPDSGPGRPGRSFEVRLFIQKFIRVLRTSSLRLPWVDVFQWIEH
jgi:hypothetical protein